MQNKYLQRNKQFSLRILNTSTLTLSQNVQNVLPFQWKTEALPSPCRFRQTQAASKLRMVRKQKGKKLKLHCSVNKTSHQTTSSPLSTQHDRAWRYENTPKRSSICASHAVNLYRNLAGVSQTMAVHGCWAKRTWSHQGQQGVCMCVCARWFPGACTFLRMKSKTKCPGLASGFFWYKIFGTKLNWPENRFTSV